MNKSYTFSPFTLIVTFVCLSLVGLALMPLLPVKLSPSQSLPGLTVSFSMPGNSSRVIEAEVTSRLESMLTRVKGVKNVRSTSDNGSGSITLDLDKHADVDATRFEVSTIIRQTWPQLPEGVSYPQIRTSRSDNNADRPFMTYTLNAPAAPILIQRYAEEHIKPVLGQLKGVYKVELTGATPMEWQLEYDTEQLTRLGITLADIQTAINAHYEKEFLGLCSIEKGADGKEWIRLVRTATGRETEFVPSDIRLKTGEGTLIGLEKLLRVTHEEAPPTSYYRINGLNSVYLSLTAEETANQLELSTQVKEKMAGIQRDMPPGYEVHSRYDATEYIRKELDKIYFRTGLTVLILLIFVALITWNLRYLFLIVTSLTVNIVIAFIFYYVFGLEMQLYSLAGITISLNLVIDNTIVMTDHIRHRRNLKAFVSVLAATLTTVGALVIIFFLDEKIRLNLQDFAAVVIINLLVSLFVALFFVPSMIEKIGLGAKKKRLRMWTKRPAVWFGRAYQRMIYWFCRFRVMACILLVLGFGLPVFLLPEKMEDEGTFAELYNKVFDNTTYKEEIKPIVDKALGGSLRLFVEKVYEGSYFNRDESEVVLSVSATLPNGSTLEQMNALVKKMETYLTEFKEIKQFQTSIYSARRASIQIYFTKEHQYSGFPYTLKANIIQFLEARKVRERLADTKIDEMVKSSEGKMTKEDVMSQKTKELEAKDSDLKNLIREYHDGLLLYEISNIKVWEKASADEAGLAAYFKSNKKKYRWDEPRFKGMAYHVKVKDDVKAVKNCVKGVPFNEWADRLRKEFNNDSIIRIRVEKGVFKAGDNSFIDKLVFKKDVTVKEIKGYPIDATYGKLLKKGPETYEDVRGLVTADYQEELERQWVADLRKKYTWTVDEEVLKTVNNYSSK